jgi:hypothetical protein
MAEFKHPDNAHIFILKLWQEVLDEEQSQKQTEWRGKIQDVRNGETHYFRDWPTIVHFISNILPDLESGKGRRSKQRIERTPSAKKPLPGQTQPRRNGQE